MFGWGVDRNVGKLGQEVVNNKTKRSEKREKKREEN